MRMNRRLLRYLVCGALVMLVALPARAQLVLNGGFETGMYSPQWTLTPGGPFDYVCQAGATIGATICIVHSGQYAMSFGLNGAQDSLSQTIPTVAGSTYTLSFWLANDNPLDQNTTTFAVFCDGNSVYSLPSPQPSFPYTEVVLNLTASTNSTPLTFVAQQDPSQWFLDDVSVVLLAPQADLAISKTDGVTSVNAGGTTTYTIVVSNNGPSNVTDATVTDVLPAAITSDTFTAVGGGGASGFTASGGGNINDTVNLPTGGTITYTLQANIASNATGNLVNTATVTAPSGVTDPNVSNNSATDIDSITTFAADADLAITKTDGVTSVIPGGTTTYTIVVSNAGPSAANGAVFTDPAVANLSVTSVTCGRPSSGAACPPAPNTTVALMQGAGIVIPTLPAAGSVTFTVNATVAGNATGTITNTANVAAPAGVTDPNPSNNSASDTDTVNLVADLAITKSNGVSMVTPGGTTTYTIVVSNNGPSNVTGATVMDVLPAAITSDTFTAVGSGGASGFTASGSGNLNDTVNLPVGS